MKACAFLFLVVFSTPTLAAQRPSTKNTEKARDPEMHQTKKRNQWYFGMKAHLGTDSKTKLIHAAVATAANVHDAKILPDLLHGVETRVCGDSAYTGQRAVCIESGYELLHSDRDFDAFEKRLRLKIRRA